MLSQWWTQPGGTPASQSEIATLSSQLRQASGLPTAQAVQQWFAERGSSATAPHDTASAGIGGGGQSVREQVAYSSGDSSSKLVANGQLRIQLAAGL